MILLCNESSTQHRRSLSLNIYCIISVEDPASFFTGCGSLKKNLLQVPAPAHSKNGWLKAPCSQLLRAVSRGFHRLWLLGTIFINFFYRRLLWLWLTLKRSVFRLRLSNTVRCKKLNASLNMILFHLFVFSALHSNQFQHFLFFWDNYSCFSTDFLNYRYLFVLIYGYYM